MNPQFAAFFNAHKVQILGGGAAAVAALGYYQRKKNAGSSTTSTTAGATIPGTIPAAAVVDSSGSTTATYDSTAFDIYDALQSQITDLASQQQTSSPATSPASSPASGAAATPPPIASTLYAPADSGRLASYANGLYEVESDGSLYHLSPSEWQGLIKSNGGKKPGATAIAGNAPTSYGGSGNLANFIKRSNPAASPNNPTPVGPVYRAT